MPLVLDGSNGVSGVDGTASNPSYEGTDSNTGIFFPAADTVAIGTGGTEALRVNSSQNVGIGGTPLYKLDVIGTVSGGSLVERIWNAGTAASTQSILQIATGASSERYVNLAVNHTAQYLQNAGVGITTLYQDYDTQFFRNNAGTVRASIDTSGNFAFNSGYGSVATAYGCRAWVNFNGTGTVAIRASGNVSSITDNGTGDYTVNFTIAMPDENYSVVATPDTAASGYPVWYMTQVAGSCRVFVYQITGTLGARDTAAVRIAVFR